ncbi:MAG TPA: hypothetical protein VFL91_32210 [Thermomicrobiales bacterium]|nr:hypothetical protein [Thermomicrobiales bacterium]
MTRALTILSVLAGWSLLGVLAVGLLAMLRPLEGIRGYLEKITMGVRAIEQETMPLGAQVDALAGALGAAAGPVGATARHLDAAARDLDAAVAALRKG